MTEFQPQAKLLRHSTLLRSFFMHDCGAPPVQVEISPTNNCNASCPWCFYVSSDYKQHHTSSELDFTVLSDTIAQMKISGVRAITWTGGGDPSVYSKIDAAAALVNRHGMRQGIFTNAYKPLAEPENFAWIRVTITEKYVITKHVAEYAKRTKVGVNFNLCQENQHEVVDMVLKARDAGVHYFQVRPALADRYDLQKPVIFPDRLKEYETDTFKVYLTEYKFQDYLKSHGYETCYGHSFVPFLWFNGDLAVCAYHFSKPSYTFGNVMRESFIQIWWGDRRRKMLENGIAVIPQCQHCCKLHEINKILAAAIDVTDVNFL